MAWMMALPLPKHLPANQGQFLPRELPWRLLSSQTLTFDTEGQRQPELDLLIPSCGPPCSVPLMSVRLLGERRNKDEREASQHPISLWGDLLGPQWGEGLMDIVHEHECACRSPPPSFPLSP